MFSLIFSLLAAYTLKKGGSVETNGGVIFVVIICDLIAFNIIFK